MESAGDKEEPFIYIISGVDRDGKAKVANHISYSIDEEDSISPLSSPEPEWMSSEELVHRKRSSNKSEGANPAKKKYNNASDDEEQGEEHAAANEGTLSRPRTLATNNGSQPHAPQQQLLQPPPAAPEDPLEHHLRLHLQGAEDEDDDSSCSPEPPMAPLSVIQPGSAPGTDHSPTKSNVISLDDTPSGSNALRTFVKPNNMPETTASSTRWAVSVFQKWNKQREDDRCPELFLEECREPKAVEKWLKLFVTEGMFNKNGDPYPPETIYGIMCGLMRYMKQSTPGKQVPNFLDKSNQDFVELHSIMDELFNKLRDLGVGADKQHIEPLTMEDERKLWDSGVLGAHNPQSLVKALFYLNGKKFGLRGGREHHNLKLSQLVRQTNPDRYTYVGTKSRQRSSGGMCLSSFRRVQNKEVVSYHDPSAGDRCHVRLLDFYISRLPPEAKEDDSFYYQPLPFGHHQGAWFRRQRVGVNTLRSMVKTMCTMAGISGRKTNNSLHICCGNHYDTYSDDIPDEQSSPETPTPCTLHSFAPSNNVFQTTTKVPTTPTTNIATLPVSVIKSQTSQPMQAALPTGVTTISANALPNFTPAVANIQGTPIATISAGGFTNFVAATSMALPTIASPSPLGSIPISALGQPLTNLTPNTLAALASAHGMNPIPLIPSNHTSTKVASTPSSTPAHSTLVNAARLSAQEQNNTPNTTPGGKGPELGGIAYLTWPGSNTTIPVVVTPQIVLTYQLAMQADKQKTDTATPV